MRTLSATTRAGQRDGAYVAECRCGWSITVDSVSAVHDAADAHERSHPTTLERLRDENEYLRSRLRVIETALTMTSGGLKTIRCTENDWSWDWPEEDV